MTWFNAACYFGYCAIAATFAYFGISWEMFAIYTAFMILDTIFGIIKCYVLYADKDKHWFSSHKLKIGVLGKVTLLFVPVMFSLTTRTIGYPDWSEYLTGWALGIFIVSEFISVLQKVIAIQKKEEISEFDAMSALMSTMLGIIQQWFSDKLSHKTTDKQNFTKNRPENYFTKEPWKEEKNK